jgi:hypothetical protein
MDMDVLHRTHHTAQDQIIIIIIYFTISNNYENKKQKNKNNAYRHQHVRAFKFFLNLLMYF